MKALIELLASKAQEHDSQILFRVPVEGQLQTIKANDVRKWIKEIESMQIIKKSVESLVMSESSDTKAAYLQLISLIGPEAEQKRAA